MQASPRNSSEQLHSEKHLNQFNCQARAIGAGHAFTAAGRRVSPCHAPDRVIHPHRSDTIDDRLIKREYAADKALRTPIEKGESVGFSWRRAKCRHSGTIAMANARKGDDLRLLTIRCRNDGKPTINAAKPSHSMEHAGRKSLDSHQRPPRISQFHVP